MEFISITPTYEELLSQLNDAQLQLEIIRKESCLLADDNQFLSNSYFKAPIPCIKLAPSGRIQRMNDSAAELLNVADADLLMLSVCDFLLPEEAEMVLQKVKLATPENNKFFQYIRHQLPDCVRSYLWSNSVIFDADGKQSYIVCYCLSTELEDGIVHQLIKVDEKGSKTKELNRRITTTLINMMLENRKLGNRDILHLINEQFMAEACGTLRFHKDESCYILEDFEQNESSSIKVVSPGLRIEGVNPWYLRDYEQGRIRIAYQNEIPLNNPLTDFLIANNIHYQSTLSVPLVGDDGYWGMMIIVRERSEQHWMKSELSFVHLFSQALMLNIGRIATQRELERQYSLVRLAIERSEIYVWEYDLNKDAFYNNEKFLEHCGYSVGQQPVFNFSMFLALIHPEDVGQINAAFHSIVELQAGRVQARVLVKNPEGNYYEWFDYNFCPLTEKRGNTGHYIIGTAACIEKFKQEENHLIGLLKAKDEAEESNRLKSAFIANMSHEIRTPLNAIVGFSEILTETENVEEKKEFIDIIHTNTDLLLRLISDILDMSKIEAGRMDFVYKEVDVNGLFEELRKAIQLRIQEKELALHIENGLPACRMVLEQARVMQVVMNLVSNAVKFTDTGSITLGYKIVPGKQEICVYVRDTGCGIPEESQKRIFDRFVKLNDFVQGTGLGLSICDTLIKVMNGKIGVTSEVGRGSEFWFTLPTRWSHEESISLPDPY